MTLDGVQTGWHRTWRQVLWVAVIALIILASVGPVIYGVLLSVRPLSAIVNEPLSIIPPPSQVDLSSYATALGNEESGGFGLVSFMRNSVVVALLTVVLTTVFSVLGAYAAARLNFFGKRSVNVLFISVYLFPGIVLAVPLFVLMSRIGLTGSLVGLLLIYVAQTTPVALYMLRNYFAAISVSVEEAAMIDGCGRLAIIWRIVLPLALPGITATGLYVFMIAWNEYLYALLFLVQDRPRWTVSLGLAQLTGATVPAPVLMAGSVAITIPVVAGFFAAQRFFVSGLTAGAEKG